MAIASPREREEREHALAALRDLDSTSSDSGSDADDSLVGSVHNVAAWEHNW